MHYGDLTLGQGQSCTITSWKTVSSIANLSQSESMLGFDQALLLQVSTGHGFSAAAAHPSSLRNIATIALSKLDRRHKGHILEGTERDRCHQALSINVAGY
jgi:hypothetical protein